MTLLRFFFGNKFIKLMINTSFLFFFEQIICGDKIVDSSGTSVNYLFVYEIEWKLFLICDPEQWYLKIYSIRDDNFFCNKNT